MRLALALGRTLAELGEAMTAEEFALWRAYDQIEGIPWPWLQTGVSTAASVNLWTKKGAKTLQPLDFMLPVKRPRPRPQTTRQLQDAMAAVAPMVFQKA